MNAYKIIVEAVLVVEEAQGDPADWEVEDLLKEINRQFCLTVETQTLIGDDHVKPTKTPITNWESK